jgi:hypothetical protein
MSRGFVVVVAGGGIGKIERRRIMPRLPTVKQTWIARQRVASCPLSGPLPLRDEESPFPWLDRLVCQSNGCHSMFVYNNVL